MLKSIWITQIVSIIVLLVGTSCLGFGQATGASLTGEVTDPTGAAIPGATVTVRNVNTGLTGTSTSSSQGVYRISHLPPGTYTLSVTAKGFSTYIQQGINLTVGLSATQNLALKVGSTKQTVRVSANAALINTTTPSIGMTINQQEVTQLPLNGRDPQTLVFLAPGITNGTAYGIAVNQGGYTFPEETGALSGVGAGRAGSTYYLLDGAPNYDDYVGLAAPFPNADATQEFRVVTNNYSAQYGFAPGAVVLIETKSGANSFHGGAWEFLRNGSFNAADFFSHQVNPLRQNQFGADFGGPILKNKLFFFVNYQGTRANTVATNNIEYTYTAAMLNGDFSGVPITLNSPFHNNHINPDLFDPTAAKLAQLIMPQSTNPDGELFYRTAAQITSYNEGTGRIDYDLSPSQRISASAFVNYYNEPASGVPGNISTFTVANPEEDYNGTLNYTWTISPKLVNTFTPFITQIDTKDTGQAIMSNNQPFCLSQWIGVADPPGLCQTEGFTIAGSSGYFYGPWVESCGVDRGNWGLYDNLSAEEGRHNLSFGVDVQRQWMTLPCDYPADSILDFTGQYTNYAMGDFFLGDLTSMLQGAGEYGSFNQWQLGLYAEDQFRFRPNLTFELGLRWDPFFPMNVGSGIAATFVPGQQSTVYPHAPTGLVYPGDKGISGGLMATDYNYFQPRVGVAWQPHALPHTAFHAGFGIFSAPLIESENDHTTETAPFEPTFTLDGTATTPLPFNNPWAGFAGTGGVSPFPPFASFAYRPPSSASIAPGLTISNAIDPNAKLGLTQAWNVAAEQQIGANTMVRLAYVGSESYNQMLTVDKNPGNYAAGGTRSTYSSFGQILYNESAGTASYNGLQVTVNHHFSHGLQLQSNFTWSKLIDMADSANIAFGDETVFDPLNLSLSRGISSSNFPIIWASNLIYREPALAGHNQWIRQILGGWEVSGIITSQSGQPFTVYGGFGNDNSQSLQFLDHANRVPGQPLDVRQGSQSHWLNQYFNVNAFTVNPPGTFGDTARNIMEGPPYNDIDAGLDKNWLIGEKYTLQFRCEMFNALNHPNFSLPNATNQIGPNGSNVGGTEGQITSMFGSPRIIQFALKLTF